MVRETILNLYCLNKRKARTAGMHLKQTCSLNNACCKHKMQYKINKIPKNAKMFRVLTVKTLGLKLDTELQKARAKIRFFFTRCTGSLNKPAKTKKNYLHKMQKKKTLTLSKTFYPLFIIHRVRKVQQFRVATDGFVFMLAYSLNKVLHITSR